jgi:hypothetical protein
MEDRIFDLDPESEDPECADVEAGQAEVDRSVWGRWILCIVLFGSLISGGFIFEDPNTWIANIHWIASVQLGLPWLAVGLVLCFPRRFCLFHELSKDAVAVGEEDRRPALFGAFFISLISFFVTGPIYISPDWVVLTLLFGALLGGVATFAECRANGNPGYTILAIPLFVLYGYVAVYEVNCGLDHSPAVVRSMAVSHKVHGGRGSTFVDLEPLSGESEDATVVAQHNVQVSRRVAESLREGGLACVVQRKGVLGLSWYSIQVCNGESR